MAVKSNFRAGRDNSTLTENVELLTGQRGDGLDRAITLRELNQLGLATLARIGGVYTSKNGTVPGTATPGVVDFPGKPLNVLVNGAFNTILIQWDEPNYRGHAYTEVWRAETNNLAVAVMIGTSAARMYADPIGGDAHVYYWVRFVNKNGVPGPYNATAGTYGETAVDIGQLLDALSGQITESQLTATLLSRIDTIENLAEKVELLGKFRVLSSGYGGGNSNVTNLLSGAAVASGARSWNLVILSRLDYTVEFTGTYDVFGNVTYAQTLADKLNSYADGTKLAIIYTWDEPQTNLTTNLKTALLRYGASQAALDGMIHRGAYILAGVPGIGADNGEEYVKNTAGAHIETTINFTNGNLDGQGSASYAVLKNEHTARIIADSAMASDITTLQASVSDALASIQTEQTVRATADSANASAIQTVQTNLNGVSSSVQTLSNSVSYMDANGSAAYRAMWAVKAQVGDITAGIGVMVSGGVSQVMVSASQFFIFDPNAAAPTAAIFAVSNGAVVIRKALIEAATIETVTAMSITADYVVAGISITTPSIVGGTLSIGSGDYSMFCEGGSLGIGKGGAHGGWGYGWHTIIYNDGSLYTDRLYASAGSFTGTVNANAGTFNNVTMNNCTIASTCDVLGTIYANKLVGDVVAGKMATKSTTYNITSSTKTRVLQATVKVSSTTSYGGGYGTYTATASATLYVDGTASDSGSVSNSVYAGGAAGSVSVTGNITLYYTISANSTHTFRMEWSGGASKTLALLLPETTGSIY